ncbi:MAG: glycosyltransferase [Candidatus Hodarchaeota archaeon]
MKRIHVGPLPPPYGGISVYLYRLSKLEKESKFIDQKQFLGKKNLRFWIIKQIFCFNKKNFIIHSMLLRNQLIFYLLSYISMHKFSLVIHGKQLIDKYYDSKFFKRQIIRTMLNKANFIQVTNPDYKFFLNRFGITNKKMIIKNAFLPPPIQEEELILKSYEKKTFQFLNTKKPKIIANAYGLVFYKNTDLYGLDLCIDLINSLKKYFPNIGLIFALANGKINLNYLIQMKNRIKELNIKNNFYFLIGQKEIWPLFKKVDLMIRPTCVDAYGVSTEEALYFNCPVIASNVCKRPEGTILFKNRDLNDLYQKAKNALEKKK